MVQQNWQRLCNTRMQVQFLAQCSGLKDPVLLQLRRRLQLWLGSDPWPGNTTCPGQPKKEKKKKYPAPYHPGGPRRL